MAVPFKQVDVFTTTPFKGNPVAVVMDARGLSTEQMQAIARWTNLSETTFVLPATNPAADYQVRIFTPGSELPFAGHPTIGTAYALIEAGVIAPKNDCLTQECGAGLVALTVEPTADGNLSISFELPEPAITPLTEAQTQALESILGCAINKDFTPALVDVGARWIVAQVKDAQSVLSTMPDYEALRAHDRNLGITGVCIYGRYTPDSDAHIEVRSFAPACGVNEDPVCGSGNGSVAAFMRHHSICITQEPLIRSSQGKILGRKGELTLKLAGGKIYVGGCAVTCISGTLNY